MYGRNSYLGQGFCVHGVDEKTCKACPVIRDQGIALEQFIKAVQRAVLLREDLAMLADKWDTSEYAIEQVSNPLLPQEQCAIELRALLNLYKVPE
jgi:hypothetical protein